MQFASIHNDLKWDILLNVNNFGDCIGFYLGLSSKSYSLQQDACNTKKVECVPRDASEGLKPFEIY